MATENHTTEAVETVRIALTLMVGNRRYDCAADCCEGAAEGMADDALAALSVLAAAARRTEQAEEERDALMSIADLSALGDMAFGQTPLDAALARVRDLEEQLDEAKPYLESVEAYCWEPKPETFKNMMNARGEYASLVGRRKLRAALVSGAAEGNSDE